MLGGKAPPPPPGGWVPEPDKLRVFGELGALLGMLSVALRLPVALGVKVRLMLQLPLTATALPQVLALIAKSAALLPDTVGVPTFSTAVPLLVMVTVCTLLVLPRVWLPKAPVLPPSVTAA